MNVIGSRISFVLAYIEIYVFMGNLFQAHSLEHSYRLTRPFIIQNQKYKCKINIKLIYLIFIHCTCKFEKHKQSLLSENCEQTFPNKKHKQSNTHEKHKQSIPSENYNRTFHMLCQLILFLRVRCSILILLIKTVRFSIRSL